MGQHATGAGAPVAGPADREGRSSLKFERGRYRDAPMPPPSAAEAEAALRTLLATDSATTSSAASHPLGTDDSFRQARELLRFLPCGLRDRTRPVARMVDAGLSPGGKGAERERDRRRDRKAGQGQGQGYERARDGAGHFLSSAVSPGGSTTSPGEPAPEIERPNFWALMEVRSRISPISPTLPNSSTR
jgi:hypothetical protein